jgi:periplasmic divalent cation tolerance protein
MKHIVVFSTCTKRNEATKIARDLLEERLAACVNIVAVSSFYWWKGKVVNGDECLLVIKTRSELFGKLRARICELNSNEVPEVVSVRIEDGLSAYLKWIDEETRTA